MKLVNLCKLPQFQIFHQCLQVIRHADLTAAAMTKFPLSIIINIVNPILTTLHYPAPIIEGSLKMLTRNIEANGQNQLTNELLQTIVPSVIKVSIDSRRMLLIPPSLAGDCRFFIL